MAEMTKHSRIALTALALAFCLGKPAAAGQAADIHPSLPPIRQLAYEQPEFKDALMLEAQRIPDRVFRSMLGENQPSPASAGIIDDSQGPMRSAASRAALALLADHSTLILNRAD